MCAGLPQELGGDAQMKPKLAGITLGAAALLCIALSLCCGCERSPEIAGVEAAGECVPFPEFFVEKGMDADSSYISLRGVRTTDGVMDLQATSWGIRETGLFLARGWAKRAAMFKFMGECGTVSSRTWVKATLHYELSLADQDSIERIWFTNFRDTLEIVRVHAFMVPDVP
jgi:hypothetical protein